jgi:hypothetical protein
MTGPALAPGTGTGSPPGEGCSLGAPARLAPAHIADPVARSRSSGALPRRRGMT